MCAQVYTDPIILKKNFFKGKVVPIKSILYYIIDCSRQQPSYESDNI